MMDVIIISFSAHLIQGTRINRIVRGAIMVTVTIIVLDVSIEGGLPGVYVPKAHIVAGSVSKGHNNKLSAHSKLMMVGNGSPTPGKFDGHMQVRAVFDYGAWSWGRHRTITFNLARASEEKITFQG